MKDNTTLKVIKNSPISIILFSLTRRVSTLLVRKRNKFLNLPDRANCNSSQDFLN